MGKQFVGKFLVRLSFEKICLPPFEDMKAFPFISEGEILKIYLKLRISCNSVEGEL